MSVIGKVSWLEYETKFLDLMAQRRIEVSDKERLDGGCLLCSEDRPHHCLSLLFIPSGAENLPIRSVRE